MIQPLIQEREILRRIAAGDENAFTQVFGHYRPFMYTVALRLTVLEWMAEEVVQDTFLRVWLKRSSLGDVDNFGGWLYTMAGNLTLNAIRKHETARRNGENWARQTDAGPLLLEEREYEQLLAAAVNRLPARQRETYRLIREKGYKREEAAAFMKISPETVKWNLDQAMRSIRAYCMARLDSASIFVIFLLIYKE